MTTLPEPSIRATPLLDVLWQDSAAGSASVASIRVDLSEGLGSQLATFIKRIDASAEVVAMAAWLVTLDRVRGDCTVELGDARFTVPSDVPCTDWLSRLKAEINLNPAVKQPLPPAFA